MSQPASQTLGITPMLISLLHHHLSRFTSTAHKGKPLQQSTSRGQSTPGLNPCTFNIPFSLPSSLAPPYTPPPFPLFFTYFFFSVFFLTFMSQSPPLLIGSRRATELFLPTQHSTAGDCAHTKTHTSTYSLSFSLPPQS